LTELIGQQVGGSFVRAELPPDNVETYRWRGDMGLLDRLSYENLEAVPRNWNMTSLDTAAIHLRTQTLISAQEEQSTNLLEDQHQGQHLTSTEINDGVIAPLNTSTDVAGPPPKRKRLVILIAEADLCRTRIDLKRRKVGNNPFGRKGTRRCLQCRKRRIKVGP
jgi:hypothetical protein